MVSFSDPVKQEIWSTVRAINDAWTKGNGTVSDSAPSRGHQASQAVGRTASPSCSRSLIAAEEPEMSRPIHRMRPMHPGEVLRQDFLVPPEIRVGACRAGLA